MSGVGVNHSPARRQAPCGGTAGHSLGAAPLVKNRANLAKADF
jgi:hypothetical protein